VKSSMFNTSLASRLIAMFATKTGVSTVIWVSLMNGNENVGLKSFATNMLDILGTFKHVGQTLPVTRAYMNI
jgi:hypothetical protein